jgi:hypothetical protein
MCAVCDVNITREKMFSFIYTAVLVVQEKKTRLHMYMRDSKKVDSKQKRKKAVKSTGQNNFGGERMLYAAVSEPLQMCYC